MSYTIFLSAQVRLRPDVPGWVLAYLRGLVEDPIEGHFAQVPAGVDPWWNHLPEGGWFGAMFCDGSLQDFSGTPGEWTFRLQGEFHDDFVGQDMTLMGMLASFALDGPIGAGWTDMGPEVRVYLASGGHLFVADLANPPVAVVTDAKAAGLLTLDCLAPSVQSLVQHGVPISRAQPLAALDRTVPAFARFLLARSLWRAALGDLTDAAVARRWVAAGADPAVFARAVAEATAEAVLAALDVGFDERAAPTAPGWAIAETARPITFGPGRTVRTISGLHEMIEDLRSSDVSAGPTPLVAGMRVQILQPLAMTATSEIWVDAGSGAKTRHGFRLLVPAGAIMTVSHVYPRGHAECAASDWPQWIDTSGKPAGNPPTPQGGPDSYRLSWITPETEGANYTIIDQAPGDPRPPL